MENAVIAPATPTIRSLQKFAVRLRPRNAVSAAHIPRMIRAPARQIKLVHNTGWNGGELPVKNGSPAPLALRS